MQTVKHNKEFEYIHPILNDIEIFYSYTSVEKSAYLYNFSSLYSFDNSLLALQDIFNTYSRNKYGFTFVDKHYKPLELPKYDSNNIIVCISGGKDSAATALYFKQCGYNVYLYHLRGINKVYTDEYKHAELIAKELDLPLYIDKITLSGKHCYIEHPLKNAIIANCAIQYGINNNIGYNIATGNFTTSFLDDNAFDICAGDCVDMWAAYESVINTIIPDFKINIVNDNYQTAYEMLAKYPKILKSCISCLAPIRYREYWKKQNEQKYNIKLLDSRCGSCWKCVTEYIYYADNNIFDFNKEFYTHCLKVLKRTYKQETGKTLKSINDVWQNFMLYDIEKSKLYSDIDKIKI